MNYPQRGDKVIEIATGRKATVVFSHPFGTADYSEPWAKVMFSLTKEEGYGVSFACRDLSELCFPWDYEWLVILAGITPDNSQFAPTVETTIRLSECSKCGVGINPFVDGFVVINGATHCDNCVSELANYCGGSEAGSEFECGTLDGKPCTCPVLCELCGSDGAVINGNGDAFCDGHCVGCPQLQNAACPCDCGYASIVGKVVR